MDECDKELVDVFVQHQQQCVEAINQFENGEFPNHLGKCFEMVYKQASALFDDHYHETLQAYLQTIATSTFEQYDVVSDQYVDGDSDAFKDSTMWLSVYTHRHLFTLAPTQKWSELFAVIAISMLTNSVNDFKDATSQLLTGKPPDTDWQDYEVISAAQVVQLAQLARHEEVNHSSAVDAIQTKADQIKSREASRSVSKRWEPNKLRVLRFDVYFDEETTLSKNEQARRFLRSLPDELKPKGDNLESQVRTLVNAHRRHCKKQDIGDD